MSGHTRVGPRGGREEGRRRGGVPKAEAEREKRESRKKRVASWDTRSWFGATRQKKEKGGLLKFGRCTFSQSWNREREDPNSCLAVLRSEADAEGEESE